MKNEKRGSVIEDVTYCLFLGAFCIESIYRVHKTITGLHEAYNLQASNVNSRARACK